LDLKQSLNEFLHDLRRALALLWSTDRPAHRLNFILQLVQAFLPVASLYFMKRMIEAVMHSQSTFYPVLLFIFSYAVTQLLMVFISQYSAYIDVKLQYKITDQLSAQILQKAIDVDYEYYENPSYHDTLHQAQQQAAYKIPLLLKDFNTLVLNALTLIFLIVFFFSIHALFGLSFIVVFIPLAIVKWHSGHKLLQLDREFVPLEREAHYLNQTLTGINQAKEVRVLGFGRDFIRKFINIRTLIRQEKTSMHAKLTRYSLIAEAAEVIAITAVFIVLAKYTWEKVFTVAIFVIYLQGFQRLQNSAKNFLQALVQLFQQRVFMKDLFLFLDLGPSKTDSGTAPFHPGEKGLSAENVSFTYPGTEKCILKNISVNCRPGKIIALVGENGSGKTTLIKLFARLYEVKKGIITLDTTKIGDIETPSFRANTVFLFQDFEKYFLSIEENIALGAALSADSENAAEHAARQAQAHDFISKLSKGYKTRIGRHFRESEQLSGGQWQKIALSRIFYRDAKLIVLDEPTSSLDPNAEFKIFENLKNNLTDQMIIIVTHRLYNLKIADYIYVLKDGTISQEGTFGQLANMDGEFRTMYENQKL